jgi:class 3 adenylate cyclase
MVSRRKFESGYTKQRPPRAIDFAGRGVHEAARIGSLAGSGQILATVNTVQSAATRFPISTPRPVTLKGVSQPVSVVTVEWM